ncbi:hypothetical protein FBU30_003033 [Linnemannia zychae]|nr:hypothetical protein FBU30_003033 [Linnemannia zychae]
MTKTQVRQFLFSLWPQEEGFNLRRMHVETLIQQNSNVKAALAISRAKKRDTYKRRFVNVTNAPGGKRRMNVNPESSKN